MFAFVNLVPAYVHEVIIFFFFQRLFSLGSEGDIISNIFHIM